MYSYSDFRAAFDSFYPSIRSEGRYKSLTDSQVSDTIEYADFNENYRPTSIAVIVWLHIIGTFLSVLAVVFIPNYLPHLPGWFWQAAFVDYAVLAIALVGLWKMKKYGAWAFVLQTVLTTLVLLLSENPDTAFSGSLSTLIMVILVLRNYGQMK